MPDVKIGVVIPTRGNRPQFLEHAKYLLAQQTLPPDEIIIVNWPPADNRVDLQNRYRAGFEQAFADGMDIVFAWEDDDWYSPDYIKIIVDEWIKNGRPVLIGLKGTLYYHIGIRKYQKLLNPNRATMACSAMSKEALDITWDLSSPFLDLYLWKKLPGKVIDPEQGRVIYVGIKHGQGKCGGMGHKKVTMYHNDDNALKFLAGIVDSKSLEFYSGFIRTFVSGITRKRRFCGVSVRGY